MRVAGAWYPCSSAIVLQSLGVLKMNLCVDASVGAAVLFVAQAIGMMLFDFAATSRADEEKITDEMKRRGLAVRTIVFDQPLDTPYRQMAGPAQDYYRRVCMVAYQRERVATHARRAKDVC